MALEKIEPQVRCTVFPPGSIRGQSLQPLTITDIFAGQLTPAGGGASAFPGDDGDDLKGEEWLGQNGFTKIDSTLDFLSVFPGPGGEVRIGLAGIGAADSPEGKDAGGFVLKAREIVQHSVITPSGSGSIKPNDKHPVTLWKKVQGPAWSERQPDNRNGALRIYNPTVVTGRTMAVQTQKPLRANEGFMLRICPDATSVDNAIGGLRVIWGRNQFSLVWRDGQQASAELQQMIDGKWRAWHTITAEAARLRKGHDTILRVENLAGLLVVSINGSRAWFVKNRESPEDPQFHSANWSSAPVRINAFNMQVACQFSLLSYLDKDEKPLTGTFKRSIRFSSPASRIVGRAAVQGWRPADGTIFVDANVTEKEVSYTITLTADSKGLASPMAASVIVQYKGLPNDPPQTQIDLRPFIQSWDYSAAEPDVLATSELKCEIDIVGLKRAYPNWREVLQTFSPIIFEVRWQNRNTDTGAFYYDPWKTLFEGYIMTPDSQITGWNYNSMSLTARCDMVRAQQPAGFIDERYAPLDLLFATDEEHRELYGGHCIKELLRVTYGDATANMLNGDGDPLRYYTEFAIPLLSRSHRVGYFSVTEPTFGSGFLMPPPYGSYLDEWIKKIAGFDRAIFFWGVSPHNPDGGIVPVYGRMKEILDAWGPDFLVIDDPQLSSVSLRHRPEKAFNDFVAWGAKPEGSASQIVPTRIPPGRKRVGAGDPNAMEKSWKRTLLIQADYLDLLPNGADGRAQEMRNQFEGREARQVTMVLPRGDVNLRWGRKVRPVITTEPNMNLNGQDFLVTRVSHRGDLTGQKPHEAMTTEIVCRPISGTGN